MTPSLERFQALSTPEAAALVSQRVHTAVFAAGGTTRWFILNHLDGWPADMSYFDGYLRFGGQQFLRIVRMFFEHGIHTLFTHAIVPGQLEGKGQGYAPLALTAGMEKIASSPDFLAFYQEAGVRVRFFGNYRQVLAGSQYQSTLEQFEAVERLTQANDRHLLFWGFNTEADPAQQLIDLTVQFYQEHGRAPGRDELSGLYYGEPVDPVDIYVSFNRTRTATLMPPLLDSQADLYFTVGLSFDFDLPEFRSILYDKLFARKGQHRDYSELSPDAFAELRDFYQMNKGQVLGLGRRYEAGSVWHPLPQVKLPDGWAEEAS